MSALRHVLIASEPGKDGVFVVVRDLVRHLHRAHPGIVVDLAWSSCRQRGGADALAAEVRAHGGQTLDLRVANAPEPGDLSALARLCAFARRRQPQIVHAHSSKAGALCRVRAAFPDWPPIVYTPNAYYGMARRGGARERFYNALESLFGHVGITACCSEDECEFAREILRLDPGRLVVIENGIDVALHAPADAAEKRLLRAELGLPVESRLLVTIGRDSPQKNYGPLYAALSRVRDGEFCFAHAGEGSTRLRDGLAEPARARCHAFEYLDAPHRLLRAADGFILTSRYEGLSLSVLGALACGTPTILSDVPGMRTLRTLGFRWTHWIAESAGEADIACAITEWLETASVEIPAQRALACECFDQARQFEKLVALYRSLV
jgi:glycosyltransferase involved in cell wall biosynthesis